MKTVHTCPQCGGELSTVRIYKYDKKNRKTIVEQFYTKDKSAVWSGCILCGITVSIPIKVETAA